MEKKLTYNESLSIARTITAKAADTKAWRVTNKRDRKMLELARIWDEIGANHIFTPRQLHLGYGEELAPAKIYLSGPDVNKRFLWAIEAFRRPSRRHLVSFGFCPICEV